MEIYILYAEHYHVHRVCMWDMINAVSANSLMPTCIPPWADTAWNLYFLYAEHCHVRDIWSMLSVVLCREKTVLCLLMVWCQNAFDIAWTQQGTFILFVYWNFALSIGYDQCWSADGWMHKCMQSLEDAAQNLCLHVEVCRKMPYWK